jgi:hypothetical protein
VSGRWLASLRSEEDFDRVRFLDFRLECSTEEEEGASKEFEESDVVKDESCGCYDQMIRLFQNLSHDYFI